MTCSSVMCVCQIYLINSADETPLFQGPNMTIFQLFVTVSALMKMVMVWKRVYESDALEIFVSMSEYLEESDYVFEEMKSHV
jgi:hypothetical protein